MPFTISHVAAAWPFEKSKLILSAVIVGAMAPDFDYFLHLNMTGRWSHSFPGVFEFTLPAALIVLAIFHRVLKRPVITLLPQRLQERIAVHEFPVWPLRRFLLIVASVLVGIGTHILWDSFTHREGFIVEQVPWFLRTHEVLGHALQNYKIGQHGSTIVGLAIVAWWIRAWYRSQSPVRIARPLLSSKARTSLIIIVLLVASGVGLASAYARAGNNVFSAAFLGTGVVDFVSATVLELLVFSIVIRVREKPAMF